MATISFFVAGAAVSEGNLQAVGGRVFHKRTPALHHWRGQVATEAQKYVTEVSTGPVKVTLEFALARGKSIPKKRKWPAVKPDIDKLARACLDALTRIAYVDDAMVVTLICRKRYARDGEVPGVVVTIDTMA